MQGIEKSELPIAPVVGGGGGGGGGEWRSTIIRMSIIGSSGSGGEHKSPSVVAPVAGSTGWRGWDGRRRGSGISARLLVAVATYEK